MDHFHESIFSPQLMGAKARAMVVTDGVDRAIDYYLAMSEYIQEKGLPFRAIIAFSGERDHNGTRVSEPSLNGFPSGKIPEMIQQDPYRILICADKFQTGYDEPLLGAMYVDKTLGGIKAVQTLSRLNRQAPNKDRVFVLDFMNNPDAIQAAFEDYYQTTILADETDPNKLHDLKGTLDQRQVYSWERVDAWGGASRGIGSYLGGDPPAERRPGAGGRSHGPARRGAGPGSSPVPAKGGHRKGQYPAVGPLAALGPQGVFQAGLGG